MLKLFPSDTFEDKQQRFETDEDIKAIKEWVRHEVGVLSSIILRTAVNC